MTTLAQKIRNHAAWKGDHSFKGKRLKQWKKQRTWLRGKLREYDGLKRSVRQAKWVSDDNFFPECPRDGLLNQPVVASYNGDVEIENSVERGVVKWRPGKVSGQYIVWAAVAYLQGHSLYLLKEDLNKATHHLKEGR